MSMLAEFLKLEIAWMMSMVGDSVTRLSQHRRANWFLGWVRSILLGLRECSWTPECRGNVTQQRCTETDCLALLEALMSTL